MWGEASRWLLAVTELSLLPLFVGARLPEPEHGEVNQPPGLR